MLRNKLERDTVVAPAFSRRWRTVVENMAMVAAATDAVVFGARQNQLIICARTEYPGNGGKKTRPTGAALVFHFGGKERQVAADAGEDTRPLFIVQWTRAGTFGAFLAQYSELHGIQSLAPLVFRYLE